MTITVDPALRLPGLRRMNYHWNWSIFWEASPEGNGTYMDMLLSGLVTTLAAAACSWVLAFVTGSAVGILRTLPSRLAKLVANAWIELFRNVPLLVQLFLWYFVLPEALPAAVGTWLKQLPNASFYTAVAGIGFYMSARMAVQLSAGIGSLSAGQRAAGAALGLTTAQTYRYVLLPVAYRIILPPMTTDMLATLKNTSVALTIGLAELTERARSMQEFSFQVFEAYAAATVAYCVISLVITVAARDAGTAAADPGACPGVSGFDFDVIGRSLPYVFLTGMRFTLLLTLLAASGGADPGDIHRAPAAIGQPGAGAGGNRLREPGAIAAAGAGDLLVFLPGPRIWPSG